MRRAFTLIEIVMTVAITGILALGTFKAMEALFIRAKKSEAVTRLSLRTQVVLDQLSQMLYSRIPASVIGYDPGDGSFAPLWDLSVSKPVLEWVGTAEEARVRRDFSGFVDMNASDPVADRLVSLLSHGGRLDATERLKFPGGGNVYDSDRVRLVFAGSFDAGAVDGGDPTEAFGWHGHGAAALLAMRMDDDGNITIGGNPSFVYEKYYVADGAYAVARAADISKTAHCITAFGDAVDDETLLLFYDYRPWKGETFCADPNGSPAGRVTILAQEVTGFRAEWIDFTIRLAIDTRRTIRGSTPVRIAKQKVVF